MSLGRHPSEQEPRSLCLITVYFANLPSYTVLGCLLEIAGRWRLMGGKWGLPAWRNRRVFGTTVPLRLTFEVDGVVWALRRVLL